MAGGILNAASEASGLLGVTVISAILTARQGAALAGGATPHAAFLAGYSAGLAAAAALVLLGGVIALRTMPGRVTAAAAQPRLAPVQPGQRRVPPARIPASATLAAAIPAAASASPRHLVAQARPCAQPPAAA